MAKLNHLYVHIPFCKSICSYCDFKRFITSELEITKYVKKIINELNRKYKHCKFQTIYIGGGTPNYLSNTNLIKLLDALAAHLINTNYEFTIECNPEFITSEQAKLLHMHKINRVSLGVQTVNDAILSLYHRHHNVQDVTNAINYLRQNKINNISLDFIYGFNELTMNDIKKDIDFIKKNKIPHVSFYSLEIKPGSLLYKQNYKLNEELVEEQLKFIVKAMSKYQRYEVSS
jgi:oxygen-independent coproporphyrinogen-3 oxidase